MKSHQSCGSPDRPDLEDLSSFPIQIGLQDLQTAQREPGLAEALGRDQHKRIAQFGCCTKKAGLEHQSGESKAKKAAVGGERRAVEGGIRWRWGCEGVAEAFVGAHMMWFDFDGRCNTLAHSNPVALRCVVEVLVAVVAGRAFGQAPSRGRGPGGLGRWWFWYYDRCKMFGLVRPQRLPIREGVSKRGFLFFGAV